MSGLSLDELTKMRIHGVDAVYVQGLRKAGYDKLSVERARQDADPWRHSRVCTGGQRRGVREALRRRPRQDAHSRRLRRKLSASCATSATRSCAWTTSSSCGSTARRHRSFERCAISATKSCRSTRWCGCAFTASRPQYVKDLKDLGYTNVPVEDLVRMRIHGVTPQFIRDVNAAGFKNMSADDLVDFSIRGRRWLKKRA